MLQPCTDVAGQRFRVLYETMIVNVHNFASLSPEFETCGDVNSENTPLNDSVTANPSVTSERSLANKCSDAASVKLPVPRKKDVPLIQRMEEGSHELFHTTVNFLKTNHIVSCSICTQKRLGVKEWSLKLMRNDIGFEVKSGFEE